MELWKASPVEVLIEVSSKGWAGVRLLDLTHKNIEHPVLNFIWKLWLELGLDYIGVGRGGRDELTGSWDFDMIEKLDLVMHWLS